MEHIEQSTGQSRYVTRTREITTNVDGTIRALENQVLQEHSTMQENTLRTTSEKAFHRAKHNYLQSEDQRIAGLLDEWTHPSLLQKHYYRKRAKEILHETHDLNWLLHASTLQEVLAAEKLALRISFAETQPVRGLIDDPDSERQFLRILSTTEEERQATLDKFREAIGSRTYQIALHELMSRKRKREKTKQIQSNYESKQTPPKRTKLSPTAKGVVQRSSIMEYPFTQKEMRLLEANEVVEGKISHQVYETILLDTARSKGEDARLLTHVMQQALTLKMLTQKKDPGASTWEFPPLVQITRVEKLPYLSVPLVSLDFFGNTNNSSTYFGFCNILVDNELYEDVILEMALLLQTQPYTALAKEAFEACVHQPTLRKIMAIDETADLLQLDHNNSADLKKLQQAHQRLLSMDQQRSQLTSLHNQLSSTLHKLDHRIRDA